MNTESILLYGGTFDPIHTGHLGIARAAAGALGIGRVLLIPSARPPHKEGDAITPFSRRLAMARLAVAGDGLFEVSDCEAHRARPSYTLETVRALQAVWGPDYRLHWLIGGDTINDLPNWYRVKDLVEACTIVTARRPDCPVDYFGLGATFSAAQIERLNAYVVQTPLFDESSTGIRQRRRRGLSIHGLVPDAVERYILEHFLYQGDRPEDARS